MSLTLGLRAINLKITSRLRAAFSLAYAFAISAILFLRASIGQEADASEAENHHSPCGRFGDGARYAVGRYAVEPPMEQHPPAIRVTTDRLEHQLPIDAVEVAFDIDLGHPVVSPASLTGLANGIDRRFTVSGVLWSPS